MLIPCSPCPSAVDYGNTKITQHAVKCHGLKRAEVGHDMIMNNERRRVYLSLNSVTWLCF